MATTKRLSRISPQTRDAIFSLRRKGLSARAIARELDMRVGTVAKYARVADESDEARSAAEAAGVPVDTLIALRDWTRQIACGGCGSPILFLLSQTSVKCRTCGRIQQVRQ